MKNDDVISVIAKCQRESGEDNSVAVRLKFHPKYQCTESYYSEFNNTYHTHTQVHT